MEQFIIDKIIDELRADPTSDPIAIVEANRIAAMDMINHAWECAIDKRCDGGRTNTAEDYFRLHFNMDV